MARERERDTDDDDDDDDNNSHSSDDDAHVDAEEKDFNYETSMQLNFKQQNANQNPGQTSRKTSMIMQTGARRNTNMMPKAGAGARASIVMPGAGPRTDSLVPSQSRRASIAANIALTPMALRRIKNKIEEGGGGVAAAAVAGGAHTAGMTTMFSTIEAGGGQQRRLSASNPWNGRDSGTSRPSLTGSIRQSNSPKKKGI